MNSTVEGQIAASIKIRVVAGVIVASLVLTLRPVEFCVSIRCGREVPDS